MPRLWFRFVEVPTVQLAELLEGLEIAAFRDLADHEQERWNKRNEWVQHWAMEEEYPHR